jgi:methylated-DNA-[protein]-cysteine S-methyltransferase
MTDINALERALRLEIDDRPLPDVASAAAQRGLLDVAYATLESPVGDLLLATTPQGLVRIAYLDHHDADAVLDQLAARVSPRVLNAPRKLDEPRRELDEYFRGARRAFDVSVDWSLTQGFGRRVLQATARIPYGSVTTYKQIAGEAGSARAFRAAGNALGANPVPIVIPCHRVLSTGGGLGGYTGGVARKRLLLGVEHAMPEEAPSTR